MFQCAVFAISARYRNKWMSASVCEQDAKASVFCHGDEPLSWLAGKVADLLLSLVFNQGWRKWMAWRITFMAWQTIAGLVENSRKKGNIQEFLGGVVGGSAILARYVCCPWNPISWFHLLKNFVLSRSSQTVFSQHTWWLILTVDFV